MSVRDMSPEARDALRAHHPTLFVSMLIEEHLRKELEDGRFESEMAQDFDLNPHLSIEWLAKKVADAVNVEGEQCTKEEVQLYWLTRLVTNGARMYPTTVQPTSST